MRYACIIISILCICFTSIKTSYAVPASDNLFSIQQPDGKTFKARNIGDEWVNYTETEDGYPVLKNEKTKFWEYAKTDFSNGLSVSGFVIGKDTPVGIRKASIKDLRQSIGRKKSQGLKVPSFKFTPTKISPVIGTHKVLVILVNFANRALITTETDWASRIFGTTNSIKHYFDEVSYNQFTIAPAEENYGTVNNGIAIVTLAGDHPNTGILTYIENEQLTKDAIVAADPDVNFASFDSDGNGKITTDELHIIIIAAGYERAYSANSPSVWAHRWYFEDISAPTADGKIVEYYPGGSYIQFGELHYDHQATIGAIIHELGHDIGLPDLYDCNQYSEGVGNWCSMGSGSWCKITQIGDTPAHYNAWCKWYLGWITPIQISNPTAGISFAQVENAAGIDRGIVQVLSNPDGPEIEGTGEYFLLENRQKVGYDSALPGSGLLIWHVDETQKNNDDETHKLVDLEEADGKDNLDNKVNKGDSTDPYYNGNNTTFSSTSKPSNSLYTGITSEFDITNISNNNSTMTADVIKSVITIYYFPILLWTDEAGYTNKGVNPDVGNLSNVFVYRVRYSDARNYPVYEMALSGYPKVHILKGGREISGSPFTMKLAEDFYSKPNFIHTYATYLPTGADYTYYFEARDGWYRADVPGSPTSINSGPIVLTEEGEIRVIGGLKSKGAVNPDWGENFKIDFMGNAVGKFECRIFSLLGTLVYEDEKENVYEGRFEWFPDDMASGIYVVSVKGPGIKNQKKKAAVIR